MQQPILPFFSVIGKMMNSQQYLPSLTLLQLLNKMRMGKRTSMGLHSDDIATVIDKEAST